MRAATDSSGALWGQAEQTPQTKEQLRAITEQYIALFQNMLNGYALCRMVYNEEGRPDDFTYLDVNASFEKLTGLYNVVGKNVSVVIPGLKDDNPELIATYGRVAAGGEPQKFETHIPSLHMWLSISVYSPFKDHFVAIFDNITERKLKEEALIRNEQNYRLLAENIADVVWVLDTRERRFLYVSPSVEKLRGYTVAEVLSQSMSQVMTADSMRRIEEALPGRLKAFLSGDPEARTNCTDVEQTRKDGTTVWTEVVTTLLPQEDGNFHILGVSRDISERRKTEKALAENEHVLRLFVEHAPAAIAMLDTDMRYLAVSRRFYTDYKLPGESIIGRTHYEVFPEIPDRWKEIHKRCLAGAVEKCDEDPFPRLDGDVDWIRWEIHPWRTEGGRVGGLLMLTEIITPRKKAEQALRETEARFRTIFRASPVGIVMMREADSVCVEANEAGLRMFGFERDELVGHALFDLGIAATPEEQRELLDRVRAEGRLENVELHRRKKDGSHIELTASYERVNIDAADHILAMFIDTTKAKSAERSLLLATQAHERTSAQLQSSMEQTIQAIATTLEMRDPYTAGHERRVADLASAIAREMGLSPDRIRGLHLASIVHDLGKVNIPSEILTKPTRLTELEYELIKTHSQSGYEILKDVTFPWPIADIVHQHHERIDGTGYPQGLKGDAILEEARIVAVADTVEAMASHRPYRAAVGIHKALEEIEKNKGLLYDVRAADACLRLFRERGFSW